MREDLGRSETWGRGNSPCSEQVQGERKKEIDEDEREIEMIATPLDDVGGVQGCGARARDLNWGIN